MKTGDTERRGRSTTVPYVEMWRGGLGLNIAPRERLVYRAQALPVIRIGSL